MLIQYEKLNFCQMQVLNDNCKNYIELPKYFQNIEHDMVRANHYIFDFETLPQVNHMK